MGLADTASSSSIVAPFSSSSSIAVPAPKMADPSNAEDLKLWPAPVEKQFIEFLLEEKAGGDIPDGQMKKNHWPSVTDEFNQQTGRRYSLSQIKEKFKRLKKRYDVFCQLIGRTEIEWNFVIKIVTGSDAVWSDAVKLNLKWNAFHSKGSCLFLVES